MQIKPFTFENLKAHRSAKGGNDTPFSTYVKEKPPPKTTYTAQDVVESERIGRENGYRAGYEKGRADMSSEQSEVNKQLEATLSTLNTKIDIFFQTFISTLEQSARDTISLAYSIAEKVAGNALNEHSPKHIEALVNQCMEVLFSKADMNVTVNSAIKEPLQQQIDTLIKEKHYNGKIIITDSDVLPSHDCEINWQDGGACINTEETWQKIRTVLETNMINLMPDAIADTTNNTIDEPVETIINQENKSNPPEVNPEEKVQENTPDNITDDDIS